MGKKYGIVKVKENLVGEGKGTKNDTEEEIRGGRVGQSWYQGGNKQFIEVPIKDTDWRWSYEGNSCDPV